MISFASLKADLQNNPEIIRFCNTSETEFINSSLSKVHCFISPYEAGEVLTDYPNYSEKVVKISRKLGSASKQIIPSSEILLDLISNLYDEEKFLQLFGFRLNAKPDSFNLNFDLFTSSLNYIFKSSLIEHFKAKPKEYLKALSCIKADIAVSVFIEIKLENLLKYFCLLEIIMKNITKSGSLAIYLIRDLVFFSVTLISSNKSCYQLKKAALSAFNYYFDMILMLGLDIFKDYLSELARSFVSVAESAKENDIRISCLGILKRLICDNHNQFSDSIEKLDPFPQSSDYDEIREVTIKYHDEYCPDGLRGDVENFLRDFNRGADGLKYFKNNVGYILVD